MIKPTKAEINRRDRYWTKKVIENAGGECEQCSWQGEDLTAHHIIHKAQGFKWRWDLENGICVCSRCHDRIHRAIVRLPK